MPNVVRKSITTFDSKFASEILDGKIKQKELIYTSGISNLVKNSDT